MAYWQDYPPTHVLVAAYLMGGNKSPKHAAKNRNGLAELSHAVAVAGGGPIKKLPEIYSTC